MKIVLLSNYFNHHQMPLCEQLHRLTDGNFVFVQTVPMRQERKNLGYDGQNLPAYVKTAWASPEEEQLCRKRILEADVVIAGSAPETYLRERIRAGKLLLRYGERPLKQGPELLKYLPRLVRWHWRNPPGKPIYLLCASAYAPEDYQKFGLFRGRCYRWGYFPELRTYSRLPEKEAGSILWAGRFLDWKHPEAALEAVSRLLQEGKVFYLRFVGTGPMEPQLRALAAELGLENRVSFLGPMPPRQVRDWMERSEIFLCTSDRQEGWGAVVNEAMNSGCAVVASIAAGAVPYLIRHGENGLVYRPEDVVGLTGNLRLLLDAREEAARLGKAAYETVTDVWNPEVAARRLMELARALLEGASVPDWEDGPCSRAEKRKEQGYGRNPE